MNSCTRCQERKPDVYTAELAFNNKTMEYLCSVCYISAWDQNWWLRDKTYEI